MEKASSTKTRKRRKELFVERFGGKCEICGYDKCINSLTFHHLNPANKEFAPSKVLYERSLETAETELKKCIMVCANCHGELHAEAYDANLNRKIKPWIDKQCKHCNINFVTKDKKQEFCSKMCKYIGGRKVKKRPTKEELYKLIQELPYTRIGALYEVSDNAIRKWAKSYGLIP